MVYGGQSIAGAGFLSNHCRFPLPLISTTAPLLINLSTTDAIVILVVDVVIKYDTYEG